MNEIEKQKNGLYYNSKDKDILAIQLKSREYYRKFNKCESFEEREKILGKWLLKVGKGCFASENFFCDFGCYTVLGDNVYFNVNCVILDSAMVEIGDNTMFGSNVQICTPTHPVNPLKRLEPENEKGKPIKIGKNCWIGSSVTILGGVTIGDNSVIGAGCTINQNIPENSLVKLLSDSYSIEKIRM